MPSVVDKLVKKLLADPNFYPKKNKKDRESTAWTIAYSKYNEKAKEADEIGDYKKADKIDNILKTAAYMFNPEGQGVLDLGIKLPYDKSKYEARIYSEHNEKKYHDISIIAYIKGTNIKLGHIDLSLDKTVAPEDRTVLVDMIEIMDPSKKIKQNFRSQYNPEEIDEYSLSRVKWGIGEFLYESAKKIIKERFPEVKYIHGEIFSKEAYRARNKVFGDPEKIVDLETTNEISQLEAQKQIPNMIFSKYTEQPDLPYEGSYYVKHKI